MTTKASNPHLVRANRAEAEAARLTAGLAAADAVVAGQDKSIAALRKIVGKELVVSAQWRGKYKRVSQTLASRVDAKVEARATTVPCPLPSNHGQTCRCQGSGRMDAQAAIDWAVAKIEAQRAELCRLNNNKYEVGRLRDRLQSAVDVLKEED